MAGGVPTQIGVELGRRALRAAVCRDDGQTTFSSPIEGDVVESVQTVLQRAAVNGELFRLIFAAPHILDMPSSSDKSPAALLITEGFEDSLDMAIHHGLNGQASKLLSGGQVRVLPVRERTNADGRVEYRPDIVDLTNIATELRQAGIDKAGVCLLHSTSNPLNESFIGDFLTKRGLSVFLSCAVAPAGNELERSLCTAALTQLATWGPDFLNKLAAAGNTDAVWFLTASGGRMPLGFMRAYPGEMLSRPREAAAEFAIEHFSQFVESESLISFEMNAYSSCLALEAENYLHRGGKSSPLPGEPSHGSVVANVLELGGDAVYTSDRHGIESLSTSEDQGGPAFCGGENATLSDAHLYLGIIPASELILGTHKADLQRCNRIMEEEAAGHVLDPLALAEGMIAFADARLETSLLELFGNAGKENTDAALCAFGSYAGLHACNLAESAGIDKIISPFSAGAMAALASCHTSPRMELFKRIKAAKDDIFGDSVADSFADMVNQVSLELGEHGIAEKDILIERTIMLRYTHYPLSLELPYKSQVLEQFASAWRDRFNAIPEKEEIISEGIRVAGSTPGIPFEFRRREKTGRLVQKYESSFIHNGRQLSSSLIRREEMEPGMAFNGPATVVARDHYLLVNAGWKCAMDEHSNLVLEKIKHE